MEMKNVLDQLKAIAENGNQSEDVARAIQTADKYSFKDRLKEAEGASVYGEGEDMGFDADTDDESEDMGFDASTDDDDIEETPGDDDQYCATCGNTGQRLDQADTPCPNCSDSEGDGDAFGNIHARVQARNGGEDDLGQDPWGIGDGDEAVEETEQEGSAVDRVQQRAQRSGEGGPLDRLHTKKEEKYSALEEEMGKVFQTPMERHQWIMQQLNSMTGDMSPEDASMVKRLMKTAGEAQVKGGNC